jgi:hypothetical protein
MAVIDRHLFWQLVSEALQCGNCCVIKRLNSDVSPWTCHLRRAGTRNLYSTSVASTSRRQEHRRWKTIFRNRSLQLNSMEQLRQEFQRALRAFLHKYSQYFTTHTDTPRTVKHYESVRPNHLGNPSTWDTETFVFWGMWRRSVLAFRGALLSCSLALYFPLSAFGF